jgi:hypothetical protein
MTALRLFALVFGLVFLLAGAAGFVPGFTTTHTHPDVRIVTGMGLLFGLFPVNLLHNLAHLLFGVWGLFAATSEGAARLYGQVVAIAYGVLTIMGLVSAMNLHTVFGLVPLYGHDIWLHAALAVVAAYFGFMYEREMPISSRPRL